MRLAVLSDAHIQDRSDPAQQAVVELLDALQVDEVLILGDLFHHWWGYPGVVPAELAPICAALLRLRDRGVVLSYVPGNHDFALGPFFHETLGADVRGPHLRTVDGRACFFAHGDEADERLGYRLTRGVLRSRAFAGLMAALGPQRGHRLLQALAGSSRDHGGGEGAQEALQALQQAWAAARLAEGAELVVTGHSHRPRDEALVGGRWINLGDFAADGTWLLLEDGDPQLVVGPEARPWAPPG